MDLIRSFHRVMSYLPLGWFILFALFVLRAYLYLGRMPKYNLPDPKNLGFDLHHGLLFFSMPVVLFILIPWLILTIILFFKNKKSLINIDIYLFLITYISFMLMGRIDPWGLDTWFVD